MIITKEQFVLDIIHLSKIVNQETAFKSYLNDTSSFSYPKIVEILIYNLFLEEFDYRSCDSNTYYSYRNLLEFCKELRDNGFVVWK